MSQPLSQKGVSVSRDTSAIPAYQVLFLTSCCLLMFGSLVSFAQWKVLLRAQNKNGFK